MNISQLAVAARSLALSVAVLASAGCGSEASAPGSVLPQEMQKLIAVEVPADGVLYSRNLGQIRINADTPICSTRNGADLFSVESSDLLAPLGQPASVDGGDRQIPESDKRCQRPDAVHLYGVMRASPGSGARTIAFVVWQREEFWTGAIKREGGDFGKFTDMRWLSITERSRRSFRDDSHRIGQAVGAFLAHEQGKQV